LSVRNKSHCFAFAPIAPYFFPSQAPFLCRRQRSFAQQIRCTGSCATQAYFHKNILNSIIIQYRQKKVKGQYIFYRCGLENPCSCIAHFFGAKKILDKTLRLWYHIKRASSARINGYEIPKYRCVGPVQQDPVNHVRRETEQH